ncbi:MAG: L-cystine transporter [Chloroflexi bacterium]|nr:L-cystine transporter [Chloroflexota bacterium]|tara:strand:- start:20398 stop:21792 length:1395 start_codon:yes stop_codon:yes gene_type:complete
MDLILIGLSFVFLSFYFVLFKMKKNEKSFNYRVFSALAGGLFFGGVIQYFFGTNDQVVQQFSELISVFGSGYIKLLKMIVIPLVLVAMIAAIMNVDGQKTLSKISPKIIGVLMVTVSISALVGVATVYLFNIEASNLISAAGINEAITNREDKLIATQAFLSNTSVSDLILSIIPSNIFEMLTGSERTATLSTILFGMFVGFSILKAKQYNPEKIQPFIDFINGAKEVVLSMVREILKLTPYAVFALMTTFMMKNNLFALSEMGFFLIASYFAIGVMFIIHFIIVGAFGLSPTLFAKKISPVLLFGFGSRSSMAALPFNVQTQKEALGVDEETANLSATFGTSIGQNGCAGIYPAMLAVMAAQVMGIPIDFFFILQLVFVIAITSFGVAGVGGGATFAAIAALTIMGLDISIVALLISIEALIDMARTALNISGSMLSGLITAKTNNTLNVETYNSEDYIVDSK